MPIKIFIKFINPRGARLRKIVMLTFLMLSAGILLAACGGGSRPLFICGLEDNNGDGEINYDDGLTTIYAVTVKEDDLSFEAISDPQFDHSRVMVAPDGGKILFQSTRHDLNDDGYMSFDDDGQGLYVAKPNGKNEVELAYLEDDFFTLIFWSRDSSRIAYMTMDHLVWFVQDDDGSDQEEIDYKDFTDDEIEAFSRWISPDETKRVWPDLEDGYIVVDASLDQEDALEEPSLTDQFNFYSFIGWSPDSTRLLLSVPEEELMESEGAGPPPGTLYVINADGSGLKRITDRGITGQYAVWSPDGEQVAYFSLWVDEDGDGMLERGEIRLMLVNADGTGDRVLIEDGLRLASCLSW
jgi:Tol biopolymer transport system component